MNINMQILINRKEYTEEVFVEMLNMFMKWQQITPAEYDESMLLVKNVFNPPVEMLPIE